MQIELIEPKDAGKKVIPINTGKVQIGVAYQPKLSAAAAQGGSKHRPKSRKLLPAFGWLVLSAFAGAAAALMMGVR